VHPHLIDQATLQTTELRGLHWRTVEEAAEHVAPYVTRMLRSVGAGAGPPARTLFLEDGVPRGG
jgi:hypothetical protein